MTQRNQNETNSSSNTVILLKFFITCFICIGFVAMQLAFFATLIFVWNATHEGIDISITDIINYFKMKLTIKLLKDITLTTVIATFFAYLQLIWTQWAEKQKKDD